MNLKPRIITSFVPTTLLALSVNALAAAEEQGLTPVDYGSTTSLVMAIVKIVGALALVVGLMLLTMRIIRKLGMGRSDLASGSLISILDTRMIAPKKYVAVLKIGEEMVAVGITDQQISLLGNFEMSDEQIGDENNETRATNNFSFPDMLNRAKSSVKNFKSHQ